MLSACNISCRIASGWGFAKLVNVCTVDFFLEANGAESSAHDLIGMQRASTPWRSNSNHQGTGVFKRLERWPHLCLGVRCHWLLRKPDRTTYLKGASFKLWLQSNSWRLRSGRLHHLVLRGGRTVLLQRLSSLAHRWRKSTSVGGVQAWQQGNQVTLQSSWPRMGEGIVEIWATFESRGGNDNLTLNDQVQEWIRSTLSCCKELVFRLLGVCSQSTRH